MEKIKIVGVTKCRLDPLKLKLLLQFGSNKNWIQVKSKCRSGSWILKRNKALFLTEIGVPSWPSILHVRKIDIETRSKSGPLIIKIRKITIEAESKCSEKI